MTDAIIQTQINAIYGAIFTSNQDAAFSNYRLFESIGFIIPYVWESLICVEIMIFCTMGMIAISFVTYIWYEKLQFEVDSKAEKEK